MCSNVVCFKCVEIRLLQMCSNVVCFKCVEIRLLVGFDWLIGVLRRLQQVFSVISRRFLGRLPVLLLHSSWHHPVSRNAYPANPSAKEGSNEYHFKRIWYEPAGDRTCNIPHRGTTRPRRLEGQRKWGLTLSVIQQFCSRRLWTYFVNK